MNGILNWIEKILMPPMAKLSEQRHLRAIRDGIISTLPLIIVGSFFLIFAQPPVKAWADAVAPYAGKILYPYRLTMGLMSLYASYGIGLSLAKSYKLDAVSGGVLAMAAFLLTSIPMNVDAVLKEAAKAGVKGAEGLTAGWVLPMGNLGGAGMFVAIFAAILAVEILRLTKKYKIMIKMPDSVPEPVSRSFEALIPAAIMMVIIWLVRDMLNFDVQLFIMNLFKPLVTASDTIPGIIVPILFITLLWSTGIHGMSVVGAVARPIWLTLLDANVTAQAAGQALPHISPEPFFQWFIWIGGAGSTLSLVLLMLTSKSKYLKSIGRASLIPGICNVNEPMIFGVPLMLNPMLVIPFILGPVVTGVISYIVMSLNIVSRPYILPPWTLPAPIGAYLATGGDWKAIILVLFNMFIVGLIYYPFFKAYERKMIEEETQQKAISSEASNLTV